MPITLPSLLLAIHHDTSKRDLTIRQLAALFIMEGENRPLLTRELAGLMRVNKPAVSRLLDRLGQDQYVQRIRRLSRDWRDVHVVITDQGRKYLDVVRA